MAQKATPEEFFEHPEIIGSSYTNNTYLFAFGSSLDDHRTLDALVREIQDQPDQAGSQPAKQAAHLEAILARAKAAILGLDAIGLTERFEESVAEIFTTLGLPVPGAIMSEMVTDQLGETIPGFSYVPEVPITPRLSQALWRLTKYDRIIYALAEEEFERRLSPTHADVEPPEWYDHASAPARNYQWGTQRERSDV